MFRGELKASVVKRAIESGKAEKLNEEIEYIRFGKPYGKIERGTVITKEKIIWGYPHIPRIFTLKNGIDRNIKTETFYVEEKIDGYNLRIASVGGEIFAFTRGGFLDPFATEKARDMRELKKFFEENPSLVLCCEMIGNTPFTEPTEDFDVKLYVFDIDNGSSYLAPLEKYSLLKKYSINCVPFLGRYNKNQIDVVKKLAFYLNKGKREGMVIKSSDRAQVVKYVTPAADIEDIEKGAYTFFDMPPGFFMQRIFRSSFFIRDFEFDREEYAAKLGAAFYTGLARAISDVANNREIEEEFQLKSIDKKSFERLVAHMGKEIGIKMISSKNENGKWTIRFSKVYKRTTRLIRDFVYGKSQID